MKLQRYVWHPEKDTVETSNLHAFMQRVEVQDYASLCQKADSNPGWFWQQVIDYSDIQFAEPYTQILDESPGIAWAKWCVGGKTNFTLQCLEQHQNDLDRVAIIAESESGVIQRWSQGELADAVARMSGALKAQGVIPGDTVGVYMPMIPEVAVAFLAVARLGAITVPLFSGFGVDALVTRLEAAEAKILISVDGFVRRGERASTRPVLDEVRARVPTLQKIILHGGEAIEQAGYFSWQQLEQASEPVLEPEIVDAEAPLLLIYTSGTTGKPKGAVLTHIGFAAKLVADIKLGLDLKASDRWLWMSDFGWVIGPVSVGGSLMVGSTLVMAEGAPNYPETDRYWQLIDRHQVTFLGVAPTLIRSYIDDADDPLKNYSLDSLRVLVSSGEPWTTQSWHWCFDNVCKQRVPILNWSGGTEISGGILTCTVIQPLKPLTFSGASPAMGAAVLDDVGEPVGPNIIGELALTNASIGLTRGLWQDDERYMESYWSDFGDKWRHGDLVSRDEDGHWLIHGRSDDVLKVGGKRTGPAEIEDLAFATGLVDQVAVVGLPDERAGQVVACVVVWSDVANSQEENTVKEQLAESIVDGMGRPYRPKLILTVDDLPRTRSGKVVRRLVSALLSRQPPGDMSTLDNPGAIDTIRSAVLALENH